MACHFQIGRPTSNVVAVLMGTVCAVLQLRQWQQHMQEQLKAHQLEELVSLQEEQQRLLGMAHVAQQDGAGTEKHTPLTVLLLSRLYGAGSSSY